MKKSKNRTIWIIALVAVVCMAIGIGAGRLIQSPAQAAADAKAPDKGPITAKVELKTISNQVTLRADATYDDPVDVTIDTSSVTNGAAIVTGQVPEVGSMIEAGTVVLQVAGRPVIALTGALPVYRSLRIDEAGPDVKQLKQALNAIGINPGNVDSDVYDADTAAAVKALYDKVGYPAPAVGDDLAAAVEAAQQAVTSAQQQVTAARAALAAAQSGPSNSQRIEAQNAVDAAQRAYDSIPATCPTLTDPDTGQVSPDTSAPCGPVAKADANDALRLAVAQRDDALKPTDTSEQRGAVTSAEQALHDANNDLAKAQHEAIIALPASEIIYLPSLPRRVDAVNVTYGGAVQGAIMTVSGATLQLVATAAKSDATLIEQDAAAVFNLPDSGAEVTATVGEIKAPQASGGGDQDTSGEGSEQQGGADRYTVVFTLPELTAEQIGELQGRNVKITIPVSSTGGDVLAVPLAALQAGPGGEARVEKGIGNPRDKDFATELIEVEAGLAAGGYVQITPQGDLKEGDLVVVGES